MGVKQKLKHNKDVHPFLYLLGQSYAKTLRFDSRNQSLNLDLEVVDLPLKMSLLRGPGAVLSKDGEALRVQ